MDTAQVRSRNSHRLRAILLGSLLAFVALEAGARVWLYGFANENDFVRYLPLAEIPHERRFYIPHPYTAYALNPRFRSKDGLNRHNSLGYRGEDIALAKPAGTYRIFALGGSTTYETGLRDHTKSFTAHLQRLLRESRRADDVEVINAGCGGWSSWESLVDLQFRGLALDLDLVIVYCGTNDVHPRLIPPELYRRDNSGFRKGWHSSDQWWERSVVLRRIGILTHAATRNSLKSMTEIKYDDPADPFAVLSSNPPAYYESNLEHMIAVTRHAGTQIMFATWAWSPLFDDYAATPEYARGFQETNTVTRKVAARNGVALFDHAATMPVDQEYWNDGRHVNGRGALVKAEQFAAFISEHFLSKR